MVCLMRRLTLNIVGLPSFLSLGRCGMTNCALLHIRRNVAWVRRVIRFRGIVVVDLIRRIQGLVIPSRPTEVCGTLCSLMRPRCGLQFGWRGSCSRVDDGLIYDSLMA